MISGGAFINYRGADSYSYAALLHAELSRRFGPELVFLDSVSIPAGADFVEQLLGRVRQSAVVLAVIGTRWLTTTSPGGGRRIDDPADWIRRELVAAFAAGIRVIPVLTDDAQLPAEAELPAELAALGRCQFRRLRHRDAAGDLARLVAELAALDTGLAAAAARMSSSEGWPVPNQLPAAARYFTGRQEELARLLLPTGEDAARAVVVSAVDGMAGVGKTALVVLAGHRLTEQGRYPDGTLFVDLHGYSGRGPMEPAVALDSLLRGLGVPGPQIPADVDARVGLYRSVTARRRVLVVLDNAREEEQIRPLLPGGSGSLVLITSRRRLSGLDEADHLNLDTLPAREAGWLFRAVAGAERDPGDHHTVEKIVRLCGYLPLAVRIAAARLRTDRARIPLTGPQLLTELQTEKQTDRLAALTEGDRSVAAALGVSYRHLPAAQQRAFVALGAHPGVEFEPYATAALLDTSAADAGRLLRGLERVSLLDQPIPGRYRLHDLIRAYATTLADTGWRAALDRLYDHYAHTSTRAAALAYSYDAYHLPRPPQVATPAPPLPDPATAAAWLEAEQANLLAAAAHATRHRPEHTTHQSATLHRHLYQRGRYTDAHTLHQHALTAVQATGDLAAQVIALNNLGWIHYRQGRYEPAADCHNRALQMARATGHGVGELDALNGLGRVHHVQGRYGAAADCHNRALEAARAAGDRAGELTALNGLGWVHLIQGRYKPATGCYTGALEAARATGHRHGELTALNGLGWVHLMQGRCGPAAECHTQAFQAARATGDRHGELTALNGLGWVHFAEGRYGPAVECLTLGLEAARATGHRVGELTALTGLGWVHFAEGRYGPAADCLTLALEAARATGDRVGEFIALTGLGWVQFAEGRYGPAADYYALALQAARATEHRAGTITALTRLGRLNNAPLRPGLAAASFGQILDLAREFATGRSEPGSPVTQCRG